MLRQPTTPKNYLGFSCRTCGELIIALALLAELETPTFGQGKRVKLECPLCRDIAFYPMADVRRFEASQVRI